MEDFLRNYGIWILLVGVFVAMHRFGMGCGGGHSHDRETGEEAGKSADAKKDPAASGHHGGSH
ncbi:MAG: hypothetical protein Q8R92_15255 [Deltaproteobacteria bacterium]|nr:hypothetical protein [Deltaproteobacteria bacterium]